MKNIPKKIYLQIGDLSKDELENLDFNELRKNVQITWCEDKINSTDLLFVFKA